MSDHPASEAPKASAGSPPGAPSPRRPLFSWSFAAVMIVLIIVAAGLYVFDRLSRLPQDLSGGAKQAVEGLVRVAEAFGDQRVTTELLAFGTEIHGDQRLQVAQLQQTEIFEQTDEATTLWGMLELPPLVVRATAPVDYVYFVELDAPWEVHLEGQTVRVTAPALRAGRPALDVSRMEYEVRSGSLIRDEAVALERLRRGLTGFALRRAWQHRKLVREIARQSTEDFVEKWLLARFDDGGEYRVEVVFRDELDGESELVRERVEEGLLGEGLPQRPSASSSSGSATSQGSTASPGASSP
ncbi:MAG: hypothetical protein AAGD01_15870 [Acidobacteriota bacterium]